MNDDWGTDPATFDPKLDVDAISAKNPDCTQLVYESDPNPKEWDPTIMNSANAIESWYANIKDYDFAIGKAKKMPEGSTKE